MFATILFQQPHVAQSHCQTTFILLAKAKKETIKKYVNKNIKRITDPHVLTHLTILAVSAPIQFAALQLIISQLPDMHSLWWVSLLGAIMSICYSFIAVGGSIVAWQDEDQQVSYELKGTSSDKIYDVLNALGTITFAYGGHSVILEIQATLKSGSRVPMMWAVFVSYAVVIFCYFTVAFSGYAAFGNEVKSDVLVSISKPHSMVAVANFMAFIHILASYQIYSQPVFEAVESIYNLKFFGKYSKVADRLVFRTIYVIVTCFVGCTLPFFGDLMGFFGAIGFAPMTFIVPSILWLKGGYEKSASGRILNLAIIIVFTIIGLLACVGSLRLIISDAGEYHLYSAQTSDLK
eukprot:TRINITY_DN5374_c0_g1_i16.p1 TRINITY_DN5374_c0_g1~~TRINITY_DN5374_c0_g1_i16.p1  ORF type:complete len:349 (+),score=12.16 TRINITY_DN5374_c0_g1_i16:127-1173(+)